MLRLIILLAIFGLCYAQVQIPPNVKWTVYFYDYSNGTCQTIDSNTCFICNNKYFQVECGDNEATNHYSDCSYSYSDICSSTFEHKIVDLTCQNACSVLSELNEICAFGAITTCQDDTEAYLLEFVIIFSGMIIIATLMCGLCCILDSKYVKKPTVIEI